MNASTEKRTGFRILLALAAVVIVVAGMRAASDLLVPFALSAFLAVISLPPLNWLRRRGAPAWLSILVVAGVLVVLLTILAGLIASSVGQFNAKMPTYQQRIEQEASRIEAWWDHQSEKVRDWFDAQMPGDSDTQREPDAQRESDVEKATDAAPAADKSWLDASSVLPYVRGTLSSLAGVLSNAFLILITVIFILLEAATFPTKLRAISGDSTQALDNLDKIIATINQYMAIKTITSIATGALVAVWLMILGIDFALLWGLFAFLLNYVPNIGSILAAVPAVLLAFVQLGPGSAAMAGIGYVVVNMLIGYVIEPRFMGRGLGLSTLVVFLSLVFWGWVLGPVGMLLSVPLTMTAKITLEGNNDTRWIAVLLGTESDAAASIG